MRWNKKRNRKIASKFSVNKIVIPVLILALLAGIYFLFSAKVFFIKFVEINLNKIECVDENKLKEHSVLLGKNFFYLDFYKIENDLKKKFFCIKRISFSKKLPDYVKMEVFGREAAALLISTKQMEASESGILENFMQTQASSSAEASNSAKVSFSSNTMSEKFVVDNEGVIFSKNYDQFSAPEVYIGGVNLSLGQRLEEGLVSNTLRILEKVKVYGIIIKEAKILSEKTLLINGDPKVVFRLDGDIDKQIASLQLIVKTAKIDSNTLELIDLRFDKPIVKFAPKKK